MRFPLLPALAFFAFAGAAQAQTTLLTATCKDGSSWSGPTRSGACRGHGGIQVMGAAAQTAPAAGTQAAPATGQPLPSSTPTTTVPAFPPQPNRAASPAYVPPTNPAAGGGPGLVWVNSSSKVYHCPNDRYYGKTKRGSYMTEPAAKAGGNRADAGKACAA